MLYGLSIKGKNKIKKDDLKSIIYGVRFDSITANIFCDNILPRSVSPLIKDLLHEIEIAGWSKKLARRAWFKLAQVALIDRVTGNQFKRTSITNLKKVPMCILQEIVHYNNRIVSDRGIDDFLYKVDKANHFVAKRPPDSPVGDGT
jgi:uncharacterized protein (DUF1697 family)